MEHGAESTVVCAGAFVLDVLARPVEAIPDGQGGALLEELRITAAGAGGGTALVLARLGAAVRAAGAIGADEVGDLLVTLLARDGVDTSGLVRRSDVQTSASVLPIRPNGDRPAFHVLGANPTFGPGDVDDVVLDGAGHLHVGGPEMLDGGGAAAAELLSRAKERGMTTSADLLTPGEYLPLVAKSLTPVWPLLDALLPNDDQITGLAGTGHDVAAACQTLVGAGVGVVAATCGPDGAVVADGATVVTIPAHDVDVVDTTGCGDAFSAGFVRAMSLGRDPVAAARLGCAVAGIVAGGLGTDHGTYDLAAVERFAAEVALRPPRPSP